MAKPSIPLPSFHSFSIKRCGVYMIPNAKSRYFDDVHKLCDSHTIFSFFSVDFLYVVLETKTRVSKLFISTI